MMPSRAALLTLGALAVLAALIVYPGLNRHAAATSAPGRPPPPGGYFNLQPVAYYSSLPGDTAAAAEVHRSGWEPILDNNLYNYTIPSNMTLQPRAVRDHAYDPRWNKYILGRITGDYTGTTDEIFQWAAAKWGMPDNLLRTIAYVESGWHQANYGDLVSNRAECPPGFQTLPCPVTFGIVGVKSTSWPGIFPWNRDSTAADVDVLGGWLRGCYEGWVWWLRHHGNHAHGTYHTGDIWGCVGAWYSGNWHDGSSRNPQTGQGYISRVKHWEKVKPWLRRGYLAPRLRRVTAH
jgi:hypothetical protein